MKDSDTVLLFTRITIEYNDSYVAPIYADVGEISNIVDSAIRECGLNSKTYFIRKDDGCVIFEVMSVILDIAGVANLMSKIPDIVKRIKGYFRENIHQDDVNIECKAADLNKILHGNDHVAQEVSYSFVFNNKGPVTISGLHDMK